MGEVASFNPQADLPNEFEYVDLESVVGTEMVSHRKESKLTAPSRAQRLARKGDIFYQTVRPYQKNNLLFELPDENYVFSTGYAQIRTEQDSRFLFCLLQREPFVRLVLDRCTGTSYPAISATDLETIDINLPSMSVEQARIGSLFQKLDSLIALHQRELDHVKELKKGLLQKMFPKEGANVPELRFPGFTDPWEQRRFGELALLRRGLTYTPDDVVDAQQGTRVLRSSNINEDRFELSNDDVFVREDAVNIDLVRNNDILITAANGSSRLVGKRALIKGLTDSAVHGGFMLLASTEEPDFFNAVMGTEWYRRFLRMGVAGGNGALGNLDSNALRNRDLLVPKRAEQKAIGVLFAKLDSLIALHQRELDHVKELKKGLLQQMFV